MVTSWVRRKDGAPPLQEKKSDGKRRARQQSPDHARPADTNGHDDSQASTLAFQAPLAQIIYRVTMFSSARHGTREKTTHHKAEALCTAR
jgi:hypothetical protein